jgi:hypothetical protein
MDDMNYVNKYCGPLPLNYIKACAIQRISAHMRSVEGDIGRNSVGIYQMIVIAVEQPQEQDEPILSFF